MKACRKIFILFLLLVGIAGFSDTRIASAKTVNLVKTARTVQGGKWIKTSAGKKYRYKNGTCAKNVWLNLNGDIYSFDKNGICRTGWFSVGKKRYYADKNGKIYVSRFCKVSGAKRYFKADGTLATSCWKKLDGKYYYFSSDGKLLTGRFLTLGGVTYYVKKSGARVCSAWITKNGKSYYFNQDGVMQKSCWIHLKKKYYYVNENGVLQKSCWLKLSGKYYYVGSDGAMAQNCQIDGYYIGEDGRRKTNCIIGNYYYDKTGKKSQSVSVGKYIFVGDSRTVTISKAVSDPDTKFIALNRKGYTWLKESAGAQLKVCLNANPDVSVVLCLGVNDLRNIDSYIAYYRTLISQYPKTRFYILSVNPVIDSLMGQFKTPRSNALICKFNKKLYKAFPALYIDSYSYLQKIGFESSDGLHYKAKTDVLLYKYILSQIE